MILTSSLSQSFSKSCYLLGSYSRGEWQLTRNMHNQLMVQFNLLFGSQANFFAEMVIVLKVAFDPAISLLVIPVCIDDYHEVLY